MVVGRGSWVVGRGAQRPCTYSVELTVCATSLNIPHTPFDKVCDCPAAFGLLGLFCLAAFASAAGLIPIGCVTIKPFLALLKLSSSPCNINSTSPLNDN